MTKVILNAIKRRQIFHIGSFFLISFAFVRCISISKGTAVAQLVGGSLRATLSGVEPLPLARRADWEQETNLPNFCKRIIQNPQPFIRGCHRNTSDMSCTNIKGETPMFSQFHQDYYLYSRHFQYLNRPGIYVDVATNDPIGISNTFFFDRCLKWRGICVEGNHIYFEPIYRQRSCALVPTCVGSRDGQVVTFGLHGGAGGVLGDTYKSMKRLQKMNQTIPTVPERCTTMKLALQREGVTEIDYLSLDVEGHELEVLKGFGLDSIVVKVMTIEVTGSDMAQITALLSANGYKRHHAALETMNKFPGLLHEDAVFLHNSVTFGQPE